MAFVGTKPAETYDVLVRQFRALCAVADGLQRMLTEAHKDRMGYEAARNTLDSERQANAILTDEIEALKKQIASDEAALKIIASGFKGDRLLAEWEMSIIANAALRSENLK